eukprot:CAMPEP_0119371572 /NCGR_PEP_ID=MMETSP1334-20130426/17717_1 /TAXON_ID=127549 /ORGANISM="Calcidiscus leptoporus, Strain RCC1130" /LENGTH=229 /DNA_ID=CAMNT_0007388873 /DNA_START=231 /DNA_END=916 /DNA_ORIENTATION=-
MSDHPKPNQPLSSPGGLYLSLHQPALAERERFFPIPRVEREQGHLVQRQPVLRHELAVRPPHVDVSGPNVVRGGALPSHVEEGLHAMRQLLVVVLAVHDDLVVAGVPARRVVARAVLLVGFEQCLQVSWRPRRRGCTGEAAPAVLLERAPGGAHAAAEAIGAAGLLRVVQVVRRAVDAVQAVELHARRIEQQPATIPERQRHRHPVLALAQLCRDDHRGESSVDRLALA